MKTTSRITIAIIACCASLQAQSGYTSFIRQVQMPSGVQWDASVAANGEQVSPLPIDTSGARFELWTVLASPLASYLLDTKYVSSYTPKASVLIRSEDPYSVIPRTRADRPFFVDITVEGLLSGASDPDSSKSVKLLRHVQSYGSGGTGQNIDRTQASLLSQVLVGKNGSQTLTYSLTSVPGADLTKVCGEERFSVSALAEGAVPESQLSSQYIQIWPVASGAISGIYQNQKLRGKLPQLQIVLNDLYPESQTYVQVYRGASKLGEQGKMVPGSSLVLSDSVPSNRVLILKDYDAVFEEDGLWTMELLTITPFGTDRLSSVSFTVDQTVEFNGMLTTME